MADFCHPVWNDWKRSVSKQKLMGCLLKSSATCNFGHGPYKSGNRFITLKQAAEKLMSLATPQFMHSLSEKVAFDRNWPSERQPISKKEFLCSKAVSQRLPFASHLVLARCFLLRTKTSNGQTKHYMGLGRFIKEPGHVSI